MHIFSKNEVEELLYNEYKLNKKLLTPKEIEEKNICSRITLKRIFGRNDIDIIWQEVAKTYKCHIPTILDLRKEKLIKEIRETAKVEGEPVNSTRHRGLYCRACDYFGSWREACMQAGIKVSNMRTDTLKNDDYRKDEIIDKLLLITKTTEKIPSKSLIERSKNIPAVKTLEKLYNKKWEDIVDILHLDLRDENKYKYVDSEELISNCDNILKSNKIKSLYEYSFSDIENKVPWIYLQNKLNISWEWFYYVIRKSFTNKKDKTLKYNKEQLLNILSFKFILLGRQMSSTEINNDIYLPNTIDIMNFYNKNIYEIWKDVENNPKYKI